MFQQLRHPAVLFVVALGALWLRLHGPDQIHPDTTRAWLMARDCAELDLCQPNGVPASAPGLVQGALWPLLLACAWRLGLPVWSVGVCLLASLAMGLAILARLRGLRAAVPVLGVTLAAVPDLQVEPTLQLTLALMTTVVALHWHERPTWTAAALLGLCAGLTADAHVAGWLAVAAGTAVGLWRGPRLHVAVALAVAVATSMGLSPHTWRALLTHPPAAPPQWAWRYGLALVPALGVGLASLRWTVPHWLGGTVAGGALLAAIVWWPKPASTPTYRDAARVARVAEAHGVGWPEALTAIRGPHAHLLGDAIGLFLPLLAAVRTETVLDVAPDLTVTARVGQLSLPEAELCTRPGPCTRLPLDPTPARAPYPFATRAWADVLHLLDAHPAARLTIPLRQTIVVTDPPSIVANARTAWSMVENDGHTLTLQLGDLLEPGDARLLPPLAERGPVAPTRSLTFAPATARVVAPDARPFGVAAAAGLATLVAGLWVLALALRTRHPVAILTALVVLVPVSAQADPPPSAAILAPFTGATFPPLYRRVLDTYVTAEAAYRRGHYQRAGAILDELWRDMPPGDIAWREFQQASAHLQSVADFGAPPCYAALRMLATCVAWRLEVGEHPPEPVALPLTVVLIGQSMETGTRAVHALDPGLDEAHAAHVLDTAYGLFDEYVLAITRGHLRVQRRIVRLPAETVPVTVRAEGTGRDAGSGVVQFTRAASAAVWAAAPSEIAAKTAIWHLVYPTQVPANTGSAGQRFVTGGMRAGPDGTGTPCFVSDDAKLLRAANQHGRHALSDAERRIALSQWLQHEFFHHLFSAYPEFHLEDKPHQWHRRPTWPSDFSGHLEADYYAEAVTKRFVPQAQPPLQVRLRGQSSTRRHR